MKKNITCFFLKKGVNLQECTVVTHSGVKEQRKKVHLNSTGVLTKDNILLAVKKGER